MPSMKLWLPVVALIAAVPCVASYAWDCRRVPIPKSPVEASLIAPGTYSVRFVATWGSRAGSEMVGRLTLLPTSKQDRSLVSELSAPEDEVIAAIPLYGWLEGDLRAVGAPISSSDTAEPDPESRDPLRPGVLLHLITWRSGYPKPTPVLTVATVSNLRDGQKRSDGGGIGMWVHAVDGHGFVGDWDEWGVMKDGRGRFCATRVER